MQCGWLKDRFGLRWQLVPEPLEQMKRDTDEEQSKRLMAAMMEMVKLDLATLRRAWEGG